MDVSAQRNLRGLFKQARGPRRKCCLEKCLPKPRCPTCDGGMATITLFEAPIASYSQSPATMLALDFLGRPMPELGASIPFP